MKNNNNIDDLIVFALILASIIIVLLGGPKIKSYKKYEFPETLSVNNGTGYEKIDNIILVLANKVFKTDTARFIVRNLDSYNEEGVTAQAIVDRLPFPPNSNSYIILLVSDLTYDELKLILSHEFIHIHQYKTGVLRRLTLDNYIWDKDTIDIRNMPYDNRPFEIDAFMKEDSILYKLNSFLYE